MPLLQVLTVAYSTSDKVDYVLGYTWSSNDKVKFKFGEPENLQLSIPTR